MTTDGMKIDLRDEEELKIFIKGFRNAIILLIILFPFILIMVKLLGGK